MGEGAKSHLEKQKKSFPPTLYMRLIVILLFSYASYIFQGPCCTSRIRYAKLSSRLSRQEAAGSYSISSGCSSPSSLEGRKEQASTNSLWNPEQAQSWNPEQAQTWNPDQGQSLWNPDPTTASWNPEVGWNQEKPWPRTLPTLELQENQEYTNGEFPFFGSKWRQTNQEQRYK